MEDNRCFNSGCMLNAEYACPCSSHQVYICKIHVLNHMETTNKDHALNSIFVEPCEKTREAILLAKCDSTEDLNNKFKVEEKIQRNFRNISIEKELEAGEFEILDNSKSSEERKLKVSFLACENDFSVHEKSVAQAYLDIVSTYQQKPSLFNLFNEDNQTNLLIYNTEIESKALIILDTPQPLSQSTCITQLPNGKLFCFGNYPYSGITLLIDENYRVEELPPEIACAWSSAIYFSNNIYCFGGYNGNSLTLSSRFDLDRNQWNELTPLPKPDYLCNSIIFNGNILISGFFNKNLLRYSIDSNSFSSIPYNFADLNRKILINAERLYLIVCYNGPIFESEIGSDTAWRKITYNSTIDFSPSQTYVQYNKEEIYIGCASGPIFKFKLKEKRLIKLV